MRELPKTKIAEIYPINEFQKISCQRNSVERKHHTRIKGTKAFKKYNASSRFEVLVAFSLHLQRQI